MRDGCIHQSSRGKWHSWLKKRTQRQSGSPDLFASKFWGIHVRLMQRILRQSSTEVLYSVTYEVRNSDVDDDSAIPKVTVITK
jgi:hypothetical protein